MLQDERQRPFWGWLLCPMGPTQGQCAKQEKNPCFSSLMELALGLTCKCIFCPTERARRKIVVRRFKNKGRTKTKSCSGRREISKAKAHLTCISSGSLMAKPVPQTAQNKRAEEPINHQAGEPRRGELVLLQCAQGPMHMADSTSPLWAPGNEPFASPSQYQESAENPLFSCAVQ